MKIKELDKWFSSKEYDPENKELMSILKLGKVKGKKVLVIESYGLLFISNKISKYAESIVCVHNNKKVVNYCKKKNNKICFCIGKIADLTFPDKEFDTIISPWAGLHYLKNKVAVIKELRRVLKDDGILLIEESDETSEYVKILNLIAPLKQIKIRKKRNELEDILRRYFRVNKSKLTTHYYFKNNLQIKEYFKKEFVFDEKKIFTKKMDKKLAGYLSKKNTLKIEEKSFFFVCKKRKE